MKNKRKETGNYDGNKNRTYHNYKGTINNYKIIKQIKKHKDDILSNNNNITKTRTVCIYLFCTVITDRVIKQNKGKNVDSHDYCENTPKMKNQII